MATVTVKEAEPTPPPPPTYVLELSKDEVRGLFFIVSSVHLGSPLDVGTLGPRLGYPLSEREAAVADEVRRLLRDLV